MICPGDNLQTMGGPRGWFGGGGTTIGGKVGCQNRPIILSYGAHAAVKRVLLFQDSLSLAFSQYFVQTCMSAEFGISAMWVELNFLIRMEVRRLGPRQSQQFGR